jgi:hypothetical protein
LRWKHTHMSTNAPRSCLLISLGTIFFLCILLRVIGMSDNVVTLLWKKKKWDHVNIYSKSQ